MWIDPPSAEQSRGIIIGLLRKMREYECERDRAISVQKKLRRIIIVLIVIIVLLVFGNRR